jgi:hypothetical protein
MSDTSPVRVSEWMLLARNWCVPPSLMTPQDTRLARSDQSLGSTQVQRLSKASPATECASEDSGDNTGLMRASEGNSSEELW